ncbi:amidohydrolase family protein [Ruminococcaceae bacterium OttesenSCG-928-D13]|nr:amidohydrolase family protein [Ruminococcaceae bacterium OttesenSCG-928-D13]
MSRIDTIIKAPHMYTMAGDGLGYMDSAAVAIDSGRILAVGPVADIEAAYQPEQTLEMEHHLLLPGFVDGHMHTSCNILRGLAQDTDNWMMNGLQPFDNAATQEERDAGSRLAIIEAIQAGTTTLGDYDHDMDAVCAFIAKVGARGNIAQTVRSAKHQVYKPGELYVFDTDQGEQSLARNIALYKKWHGHDGGRIRVLFGPQGADFMDTTLLQRCKDEAKKRGTRVHIHLQQGSRELAQMEMRYGMRTVAFLEQTHYLDENFIVVHLTSCEEDEVRAVAKTGAGMVVCPGSIAIIDGLVCPSMAFQQAGGACGLGSDQAPGNNCHNIINEMKNVALFNKIMRADPEVMPAWAALRMATIEGARAIGLGGEIGSLEAGKKADLIAVDLNYPSMQPVFTHPMRNMVPNLVYSARGREVALSMVDGRVIMRDGVVLGADAADCLRAVAAYPDGIGARAEKEFFAINGTNAQYMRNDQL